MTWLEQLKNASLIEPLGWTILHSLWQGTLIAIIAAIALWIARCRSARLRYVIACIALFSMLIAAAVTFAVLRPSQLPPTAIDDAPVRLAAPAIQPMQLNEPIPTIHPVAASLTDRIRPILPSLALTWIVGVLLLGAYHAGGWMLLRRLRFQSRTIADISSRALLTDLIAAMGINRTVQLCESVLVQVPTVIGWLSPIILLPASAIVGLSPSELRGLLAHELAHIRRHDYLVNLLQTVIETLLFYHPATWWLGRVIRQERENCCDDLAAAVCDRTIYAQALATMESLRQSPQLALSAKGSALLPRIRRILGLPNSSNRRSISSGIVSASILVAVIAGGILLNACRSNGQLATTKPTTPSAQRSDSSRITLQGRITEAATGKPVPNVKVEINGGIVQVYGGSPGRELFETETTDADGRYHLDRAFLDFSASKSATRSGDQNIYLQIRIDHPTLCSADGRSRWDVTIPPDSNSATKDFQLVPGGKLIGTVNDQMGQGDSNLELAISSKDKGFCAYTTTGADGQFVTPALFPGDDYTIVVNDANLKYPQLATAQVRAGQTSPIELNYDPPTTTATTETSAPEDSVEELQNKINLARSRIQEVQLKLRDLEAQSGQTSSKEAHDRLEAELSRYISDANNLQIAIALAQHEVFPSPAATAVPTTQPTVGAPNDDDLNSRATLADLQSTLRALDHFRQDEQSKLDAATKAADERIYDATLAKERLASIDQQRDAVAKQIAAKSGQTRAATTQPMGAAANGIALNIPATQPALPQTGEYYISGLPGVQPGVYAMNGERITVLQALVKAGMQDWTPDEDLTVVHRDGGRRPFKISDVMNGADGQIAVQPGDVLLIGNLPSGEYYMGGDVPRVGVYSLTGRKINLLQALISAGADPNKLNAAVIELRRRVGDDKVTIQRFTVKELMDDPSKGTTLQPYDQIFLKKSGTLPATRP